MGTTRYICRISVLASDSAHDGQSSHYASIVHSDKKNFTIGSSNEADVQISGTGIASLHAEVTVDPPHLFIRSLGAAQTFVSTHQVASENLEPFRSGEAIRLGQSKQVLIIELFKKYVEAAEEGELIVHEVSEKAKIIENSIAEQKRELNLLTKQSQDLKAKIEKEVNEKLLDAKQKAEEIHQAALRQKDEIIQSSEKEAALIAQRAESEIAHALNEIRLNSEEKKRALMDQVRVKAKEIKQEAETEVEAIVASGQREADLLIAAAKNKAKEITEESQREVQALLDSKGLVQNEIKELQTARIRAHQELESSRVEVRTVEASKNKVYREFELEKERLRSANEALRKQLEILESTKRGMDAELTELKKQSEKVTDALTLEKSAAQKYLDNCAQESQQAIQTYEKAKSETEQLQRELGELKKSINDLQPELTKTMERISNLKVQEVNEREQTRAKLKKEYEVRLEFEKKWLTKQRQEELEQMVREKKAKAIIEVERLNKQAQTISESIQSLITVELMTQFGEEQTMNFKPQLERVLPAVVQRCVREEYEYRRENWEKIRPFSFATEIGLRAKRLKRQVGVTTLSILFFMAALLVSWFSIDCNRLLHSINQSCSSVSPMSKNPRAVIEPTKVTTAAP